MIEISPQRTIISGDLAAQIARLRRAMKKQGRRLLVDLTGNVSAVDGQPLPSAEQIEQLLASSVQTSRPLAPITARQLRLWLAGAGILGEVEGLIAGLPEPQRTMAGIEWEFSISYERNHPLVIQLGTALGMTSQDLDTAWVNASKL